MIARSQRQEALDRTVRLLVEVSNSSTRRAPVRETLECYRFMRAEVPEMLRCRQQHRRELLPRRALRMRRYPASGAATRRPAEVTAALVRGASR
jgi:hypothetical protein